MKKLKLLLVGLLGCAAMLFAGCGATESQYQVKLMDGTSVTNTYSEEKGSTFTPPDAPSKNGYSFVGWFTDAELNTPYAPGPLSGNLTLYAKYIPAELLIQFKGDFGSGEAPSAVAVSYGGTYQLPTPTREGYTFAGWVLDGEDFPMTGTYDKTTSVRLTATWEINKYTVTYLNGEETLGTKEVEHGQGAQLWTEVDAGYRIDGIYVDAGFETLYDASTTKITQNTNLYVKIIPATFNIFVNELGGSNVDTSAQYLGNYSIAEPVREGYIFIGFVDVDGNEFAKQGSYTWTKDVTITAVWEKDPDYHKTTILFYDGNVELAGFALVVDDNTAFTIPNTHTQISKKGHTFGGWYVDKECTTIYENGTIINPNHVDADIVLYAKYTPNTYKIKVNLEGGVVGDSSVYEIPVVYGADYSVETPSKVGYKFLGYNVDVAGFAFAGKYEYDFDIILTAEWEELIDDEDETTEKLFIENVDGKYFKVREDKDEEFTYVFLVGVEYNLAGNVISVDSANAEVSATAFKPLKACENATITFNKYVGEDFNTFDRKAIFVENVDVFTVGSDYQSAWVAPVDETQYRTEFMFNKVDEKMSVGQTNFIPDVNITSLGKESLTLDSANIVVTATVDGEETNNFVVKADGSVDFGAELVGKTVKLTLAPKYALTSYNIKPITFEVNVNNAVNVYTNEQLQKAYSDVTVQEINILRNITPALSAEHLYYHDGVAYSKNNYEYGYAYMRFTNIDNDKLVVNGNFFSIDAKAKKIDTPEGKKIVSSLPEVNNDICGTKEWVVDGVSGYYVTTVQSAIFGYWNYNALEFTERKSGSDITFKNLRVVSNNVGDSTDTVLYKGKPLLINSSSFVGYYIRGGKFNFDNVTIQNANIGVSTDSSVSINDKSKQAVEIHANGLYIDNSFNSSMYMFRESVIDLKNSKLGSSSGPAITAEDMPADRSDFNNSVTSILSIDSSTVIENWLTGEEAWFISRGMGPMAAQLKAAINASANQLGGTILKEETTGQYFNIVFVGQSNGSTTAGEWNNDVQKKPYMKFEGINDVLYNALTQSNPNYSMTAQNFISFNKEAAVDPSKALLHYDPTGAAADAPNYLYGIVEVMPIIK